MNKQRRKDLNKLIERLEAVGSEVEEIRGDLECLKDEEQEYYDNMPESIQGSDKGSAAEEAIETMESADEYLSDLLDNLQEVLDKISEAME